MKVKAVLLGCLLFLTSAFFASPALTADKNQQPADTAPQPSPATLAQAEELARLVGMDQIMRRLSAEAVLPLVRQVMAANADFTPQDLDDMSSAWQDTVWQDLEAELVHAAAQTYARRLSAAEISQALAFFKSPLGRKLVATQPRITGESRQAAQEVIKAWLKRINADPNLRKDFFGRVAKKLPPALRTKTGNP